MAWDSDVTVRNKKNCTACATLSYKSIAILATMVIASLGVASRIAARMNATVVVVLEYSCTDAIYDLPIRFPHLSGT